MTDTTTKFFLDTVRERLKRAKDANRVDVKIPARDLALLLELAETKAEPVFDLATLAAFAKKPDVELQYVGPSVVVVPQTDAPLPPNTVVCDTCGDFGRVDSPLVRVGVGGNMIDDSSPCPDCRS